MNNNAIYSRSAERKILIKAFAANRRLIAGLFAYFAAMLFVMFLLQLNGLLLASPIWRFGIIEAGICTIAACVIWVQPNRTPCITILGYASGFIFLLASVAAIALDTGPTEEWTLFLLVLFFPFFYMAANLSTYQPLIKISSAGAALLMIIAVAAALIQKGPADSVTILWLVIAAAQPTYFAMQSGVNALNRIVMQTAQESVEGKSVLLGMLSHELRTPLQTIRTAVDLLTLKGAFEGDDARYLDRILLAARQLESHLGDLAEFSKLESGLLQIEHTTLDLSEIILGVADAYADEASQRQTEIEVKLWKERDLITGDPTRIQQVINNLVSNAVKYTDQGRVEIETIRDDSKPDVITICIRDTGIGIDPDRVSSIWMPYLRLSNEKRAEGHGLGLAIVRMLVQLMDGSIDVKSKVGAGSIFSVTLPVKSVSSHEAVHQDENL